MLKYLLDTNICIYIAKHKPVNVLERFSRLEVGSVGMSLITFGELRYGALRSQNKVKALAVLDELSNLIPVINFSPKVAIHYSEIRADLANRGLPIGNNDLWIAAHALAVDKILVTNNVKEFERVENLQLENWV